MRAFDYEALYEQSPLEDIPLGPDSEAQIARLIEDLSAYRWDEVRDDVLGSIFENMIPDAERIALGQYYTKPQLADVIVSLCMTQPQDQVFDPGVGTGTFLTRAHERIRSTSALSHEDILGNLWAVDISAFPAELAVLNLCRLDLTSADNFPRVAVRDFFTLKPGERLSFPPAKRHAGSTQQVVLPLPQFDSIIGNPPYVRSQQLDDLEASYKAHLHGLAKRVGVGQDSKFDAYVYYFLHATQFLKDGGRIGFVTSAAWLTSGYGAQLQRFMLDHFQPVLILWSEVEPFFPNQGVDTVVTILEKLTSAERKTTRGSIRFVTFTDTLDNLLPPDGALDYWARVDQFVDSLEASTTGEHKGFRTAMLDGQQELTHLKASPADTRSWSRPLKTTSLYRDLFGAD